MLQEKLFMQLRRKKQVLLVRVLWDEDHVGVMEVLWAAVRQRVIDQKMFILKNMVVYFLVMVS